MYRQAAAALLSAVLLIVLWPASSVTAVRVRRNFRDEGRLVQTMREYLAHLRDRRQSPSQARLGRSWSPGHGHGRESWYDDDNEEDMYGARRFRRSPSLARLGKRHEEKRKAMRMWNLGKRDNQKKAMRMWNLGKRDFEKKAMRMWRLGKRDEEKRAMRMWRLGKRDEVKRRIERSPGRQEMVAVAGKPVQHM